MIGTTNGYAWQIEQYGNEYMGKVYIKRDTAYTAIGSIEQVKRDISAIIAKQG